MRKFLFYLLIFAVGFLIHAIYFPNLNPSYVRYIFKNEENSQKITSSNRPVDYELIKRVLFDGRKFDKKEITIQKSRYIEIVNTNTSSLMELVSDHSLLNTIRGMGESEALSAQLNDEGIFYVKNKNNPNEMFSIIVK